VARREAETELEALRFLVVDDVDGPSSLAASMSTVAEQLKSRIDVVAANGVH
jgi:hypothetical protein